MASQPIHPPGRWDSKIKGGRGGHETTCQKRLHGKSNEPFLPASALTKKNVSLNSLEQGAENNTSLSSQIRPLSKDPWCCISFNAYMYSGAERRTGPILPIREARSGGFSSGKGRPSMTPNRIGASCLTPVPSCCLRVFPKESRSVRGLAETRQSKKPVAEPPPPLQRHQRRGVPRGGGGWAVSSAAGLIGNRGDDDVHAPAIRRRPSAGTGGAERKECWRRQTVVHDAQ